MRILWVSHMIPYPPKSGAHLRGFNLLRGVAARHEVDLVAFVQEAWLDVFFQSREQGLQECSRALGEFCRSVRFLPIESVRRFGGKGRTALAGLLLPASYTIRWLDGPNARGVFAEAARNRAYALAHFDTIGLAPYRGLFKGTPATLGHHNIESHMLLRRAENELNPLRRLYYLQEGRRVQAYERKTAGSFSVHITCSDLDSQRLVEIAPAARVVTIPNGVDIEYFHPGVVQPTKHSLIFVGSLNWYPNVSAVSFLLQEIWPRLKAAIPDLALDIVGSAPPRTIVDLASALPDVRVHGFVDDVRPLIDAATLYVCPIRDGGGTKLKLLDAFAMRKCVVAHPIACEGIDVTAGENIELADSAESFVDVIQQLLDQPARRSAVGEAARKLVVERYGFAGIGNRLCDVLEGAAAQPASPN